MKGRVPERTILGGDEDEGIPASHPLFYTQERSKYLERLCRQTAVESELPTNDLRRNLRVDHYLNQYNIIMDQRKKEAKIKASMLKANEFDSIFCEQETQRREEDRQKRRARKIQQQLFATYVQNPQLYQPAEHDSFQQQQPIETPSTVLEMGGNRQRELYLLDLQIGRLRQEENLEKQVKWQEESCRNNQLLGKLSSSLVSSYLVHFDSIFGLLMDQMLEEEVIYLNHLEARHKVGTFESGPASRKTVQMAELVAALDDLCEP